MRARCCASEFVLDVGLWPVRAASGFGVPASFLVFIFDDFSVSRHGLLLGCGLRGRESVSMGWKGFREDAVHFVRPPAIVFDNLVRHLWHRKSSGTRKVLGSRIAISAHCASHLCRRQRLPPRTQAMEPG